MVPLSEIRTADRVDRPTRASVTEIVRSGLVVTGVLKSDPGTAQASSQTDYVPGGWSRPGTLPSTVGAGRLLQDVTAAATPVPPRRQSRRDAGSAAGRVPAIVLSPGFEPAPGMYTTLQKHSRFGATSSR